MTIRSRVHHHHHHHHHHILFAYRSGSFFRYPHHCEIADFRKFISITDTVTGRCSWHSANDGHQQGNEYTTFWKWSCRHPGPNPVNPEIWIWIPDHFWLRLDVPCALWAQSSKTVYFFTNDESLTCVIRCYVHLAADADILFIWLKLVQ